MRPETQQTNIKISVLIKYSTHIAHIRRGYVLGGGREPEVGVGQAAGLNSESERRPHWEVRFEQDLEEVREVAA